jgi:hypothetical protein
MVSEFSSPFAQLYERIRDDKVKAPAIGESSAVEPAEPATDAVETASMRVDSMGPLAALRPSSTIQKEWRYYSLRTSRLRKKRLDELAVKYNNVCAAPIRSLVNKPRSTMNFMN